MAQYGFGPGAFWATPTQDAYGNAIATPTPVLIGVMQEMSLDISFDSKELYGQNQFPVQVGRGKGKMAGKVKFAQFNGQTFNTLMFGQTMTSASLLSDNYDTTGSVIPASPYQVTPTVPNSGTWSADLGVRNSNGRPLTRVASAPATGQYSVAAGVYTFAAADTGSTVFISYQYTSSSVTTANRQVAQSLAMGYAPLFKGDLYVPYQGKSLAFTIPQCLGTKMNFQTKLDDFLVPEFDFSGFADASGNGIYWSTSE